MSKEDVAAFLDEMRTRHGERVEAIEFPEGTAEYVADRIAAGDAATLLFMMKFGYLMGLQTGFAAGRAGEDPPQGSGPIGPLQA